MQSREFQSRIPNWGSPQKNRRWGRFVRSARPSPHESSGRLFRFSGYPDFRIIRFPAPSRTIPSSGLSAVQRRYAGTVPGNSCGTVPDFHRLPRKAESTILRVFQAVKCVPVCYGRHNTAVRERNPSTGKNGDTHAKNSCLRIIRDSPA